MRWGKAHGGGEGAGEAKFIIFNMEILILNCTSNMKILIIFKIKNLKGK